FRGGGQHSIDFYDVISFENLFLAWKEFCRGKRKKEDVVRFELSLEDNLINLSQKLQNRTWQPDPYSIFKVCDPKLRTIHKATVRDRVLYQAVYRALYQTFDRSFIFHTYSSRDFRGTHRGVISFEKFSRKVSQNYTRPAWAVKCDVRKFFDSIDQKILLDLIDRKVKDRQLMALIRLIVRSFEVLPEKGLPLGNVTSQLFANIYLHELDTFVKKELKVNYYLRYCDDFAILLDSEVQLKEYVEKVKLFLKKTLLLDIHPHKIIFRKLHQGMDFLGYVMLPHRRVLRTRTKKRMLKKMTSLKYALTKNLIEEEPLKQRLQSYLGMLTHCKGEKINQQIGQIFRD
ncbi:MAG: reverse transcriptase domain-containing protein, partial [Candidatus Pacebacteria bacterium]|nr:reverse transcriptase domain-containing protein [Candidatus Paceibacterota bacterium]